MLYLVVLFQGAHITDCFEPVSKFHCCLSWRVQVAEAIIFLLITMVPLLEDQEGVKWWRDIIGSRVLLDGITMFSTE